MSQIHPANPQLSGNEVLIVDPGCGATYKRTSSGQHTYKERRNHRQTDCLVGSRTAVVIHPTNQSELHLNATPVCPKKRA